MTVLRGREGAQDVFQQKSLQRPLMSGVIHVLSSRRSKTRERSTWGRAESDADYVASSAKFLTGQINQQVNFS